MRLDLDFGNSENNVIHACEDSYIQVNDKKYHHSIIVTPTKIISDISLKNIAEISHYISELILGFSPEVVLIGTGKTQQFLDDKLLEQFYQKKIGVEVMTTLSACKTYNVLMSEDRLVVALLIF